MHVLSRGLGLLTAISVCGALTLAAPVAARASTDCPDRNQTSITPVAGATDTPFGVTAGPGGTWYGSGQYVVQVRANGTSQTFVVEHSEVADVGFMTTDGGSVLFADRAGYLGRISGTGRLTEWTVPPSPAGASPGGVAVAGGMLWFTDSAGNRIGRLDLTTGTFAVYAVPTPDSFPLASPWRPTGTSGSWNAPPPRWRG